MAKKSKSRTLFKVAITEELRDRLAYFMGEEIASTPRFWRTVLEEGIDKMESDLAEIYAGGAREPPDEEDDIPF